MTPTLIAYVLSLPLPVRLALLDADPTGAGWLVNDSVVSLYHGVDRYIAIGPMMHERVVAGHAWLPCNPLAIAEHAARLFLPGQHWYAYLSTETPEFGPYRARIEAFERTPQLRVEGPCPHTAAVRLLAEVTNG